MDELFRFMVMRPPRDVAPEKQPAISLHDIGTGDPETDFQRKLTKAYNRASLQDVGMIGGTPDEIIYDFMMTGAITDSGKLPEKLTKFSNALHAATDVTSPAIMNLVQTSFGMVPGSVLADNSPFWNDRTTVADTLVAYTLAQTLDFSADPDPTKDRNLKDKVRACKKVYPSLALAIRAWRVLELAAKNDPSLATPGTIASVLTYVLVLPEPLYEAMTRYGTAERRVASASNNRPVVSPQNPLARSVARLENLKLAIDELGSIKASDFRKIEPEPAQREAQARKGKAREKRGEELVPALPDIQPWILSDKAIDRLSQSTKDVIADSGIALDKTPLPDVTNRLEKELIRVGAEVYRPEPPQRIVRIGSTWLPAAVLYSARSAAAPERKVAWEEEPLSAETGAFRRMGFTDLEVVKQELLRYEAGEIAHIENVLKGESKERSHRRLRRTEEFFLTETETTTESEQDLQSTERFEMQRETQETQKEESKFDAGITVKYGGFVDVEASAKYATADASEKSSRTASSYAREVTERSVARIQERVHEQRTRKTIEEFEEINKHGVVNTGGTGHVVGVYRWVDKRYRAQIYNYGKRAMCEFMVPEPAAFLRTQSHGLPEGFDLEKPKPPTIRVPHLVQQGESAEAIALAYGADVVDLREINHLSADEQPSLGDKILVPKPLEPADIKPDNYQAFVQQYQVTDATPPVALWKIIAHNWKSSQTPDTEGKLVREQAYGIVKIPEEYVIHIAFAAIAVAPNKSANLSAEPSYPYDSAAVWEKESFVDITIGHARAVLVGNLTYHKSLAIAGVDPQVTGEYITIYPYTYHMPHPSEIKIDVDYISGDIPVSIQAAYKSGVSVTTLLLCKRHNEGLRQWQHKTYSTVIIAYQKMRSDYEEKLAAAQAQEGIVISGRNPTLNREAEQNELKKVAIMLLMYEISRSPLKKTTPWDSHLENIGSVDSAGNIEFSSLDVQAPHIQFLEQAFEWNQMVYTFYPYYWARKGEKGENWALLTQLDDNDPMYAKFLRAGAARVVVPVRPGYEEALNHYLTYGHPWQELGEPEVVMPPSVPIVQEIREQQGFYDKPGAGTLKVEKGNAKVTGEDTAFEVSDAGGKLPDVNREIFIRGRQYRIKKVISAKEIELTEPYAGSTENEVPYSLGVWFDGEPWEVKIPTSLVILQQGPELPDFTKDGAASESLPSSVLPSRLTKGGNGRVSRTDGSPQPVIAQPSISAATIAEWPINERFTVMQGPVFHDGYRWWFVQNANGQQGWVYEADDRQYYLEPIGTYYVVSHGDTLGKIAVRFGTTVQQIVDETNRVFPNTITNPDLIYPGMVLIIP